MFHLYVCAAFLDKWSDELKTKDFQVFICIFEEFSLKKNSLTIFFIGNYDVFTIITNSSMERTRY